MRIFSLFWTTLMVAKVAAEANPLKDSGQLPPQPPLQVWPVPKKIEVLSEDSPARAGLPDGFHLSLSIDEASFRGSSISPQQLRFLYHYYGRPTRGHSSPLRVRLSYTPSGKEGSYKILCDIPWCKGRASSYEGAVYLLGTMIQIIEGYPYVDHTVPQKFVIDDYPSFPYRGMLIDTGRHYLPMEILYKNLQLMSFNKMNVLHWHLTDDIAFSLDLTRDRRYSRLQEGNPYPHTYSKREIIKFVKFANLLGIKVIPEIDVPAHTQSWIRGYPELQGHALYWMDPTSRYTKEFVKGVVSEVADIFYGDRRRRETYNGERVIHLGGDETWDAWDTPYLRNWTRDHGRYHNKTDLVNYWLTEVVADIAESTGSKITLWNDFLNDNAEALWPVDTWQIWLYNPAETVELAESGRLPKGSSVLFSEAFYLDALSMTWADFYKVPFHGDCYGVIKGGEACMWGEFVDASNFMPRVWPRASAIAERLWCDDQSICPLNESWAVRRLSRFRCFMSSYVLRHSGPEETSPLGWFQDISAPARFYSFNLIKDQWWCPEWSSGYSEHKRESY
ncbi:hypothetical protein FOZ63_032318, partial [Perkinsus olseni]